ncbi:MAG TPA: CARDB domain-containing protein, partial [Desulfatiglandales bacterium]|nr:CARDB domain-containing protein [Desulfatiglandales bacterium]
MKISDHFYLKIGFLFIFSFFIFFFFICIEANAAASGYIVSVTQPTYVGGQASSVTVIVKNISSTQDFIIDYGSKPSGWSISPSSFNPDIDANSYYYATFTVTPPVAGGSGTIIWQFKEDGLLSNPILDTYSDSVSAAVSKADLIVTQVIDTASSYNIGDKINAKATIKNNGQASAGSSKIYYYLG